MDIKGKVGKKLKSLRLEVGISQEKLAEYLGVHVQTITRIENGKTFINEVVLEEACKFFDVRERYFFDFSSKKLRKTDIERISIINEKLKIAGSILIKYIYKIVCALCE